MATHHRQYYQPSAVPMSMPSKAPAPASMYPVSRVPGSPTDYSDASTTAGSRSSGGLTFSSAGGDYDSSSASYSGVDVVEVLSDRMQDAFDPTPLDKSLASQAQTSGQLHAKQQELLELQAMAERRMRGLRANFNEGLKTARETKRDLEWTQKRVSSLKSKAEKAHPEEYRRASKKYTFDDY